MIKTLVLPIFLVLFITSVLGGEKEKIIIAGVSFDINESSDARRLRKIRNLQGRPGTSGEGSAADEALKKLFGPQLPKV